MPHLPSPISHLITSSYRSFHVITLPWFSLCLSPRQRPQHATSFSAHFVAFYVVALMAYFTPACAYPLVQVLNMPLTFHLFCCFHIVTVP